MIIIIIQKWNGGILSFNIKEISKNVFINKERLYNVKVIKEMINMEEEIIWMKK